MLARMFGMNFEPGSEGDTINVHDYATRLARADERAGAGTLAADPVVVVRGMLETGLATDRYELVRNACLAVYGEATTAQAERGLA